MSSAMTGGNDVSGVDISIVAPCYNEEEVLPEFVRRTCGVLAESGVSYEIILVDDGSRDGTWDTALRLTEQFPSVTVIKLSRNFGHQAAVTAGLDYAVDSAVVLIDADLQDPPEVVLDMIAKWREGYNVVYGQRRTREGEGFFKLWTAKVFYRLMAVLTNQNLPHDAGDFRLMDRQVAQAVRQMREKHRFIRGMVSWVGFRQTAVAYDRHPRRAGTTKYPFAKMFLFALDAVTSFSTVPLRMITVLGMTIVVATSLLSLVIVGVRVFQPHYFIPGFTALALLLLFFGGLQLLSLGVVGEYIGRIYEEVKERPLYLIREIALSDVRRASVTPADRERIKMCDATISG
jgi:dolichol-phosphate mannosyltransferase